VIAIGLMPVSFAIDVLAIVKFTQASILNFEPTKTKPRFHAIETMDGHITNDIRIFDSHMRQGIANRRT